MTRLDWDRICTLIQSNINNLCNHDMSKQECYEDIKELVKPDEFEVM